MIRKRIEESVIQRAGAPTRIKLALPLMSCLLELHSLLHLLRPLISGLFANESKCFDFLSSPTFILAFLKRKTSFTSQTRGSQHGLSASGCVHGRNDDVRLL